MKHLLFLAMLGIVFLPYSTKGEVLRELPVGPEQPPPALITPTPGNNSEPFDFDKFIDAPPEVFANALLQYSQEQGIDIEVKMFRIVVDSEFKIRDIIIIPLNGIEESLRNFIRETRETSSDLRVPIILQYSRPYSVREFTDLFSKGEIKFHGRTQLGRSGFITSAPVGKIEYLAGLDYIKWIGLYKPSYKYSKIPLSEEQEPAVVTVLGKTNDAHKNDLERLGVDVTRVDDTSYSVNMNAKEYPMVANLLWVVGIDYTGRMMEGMPLEFIGLLASERPDLYSGYEKDSNDNNNRDTKSVEAYDSASGIRTTLMITFSAIVFFITLLVIAYFARRSKDKKGVMRG